MNELAIYGTDYTITHDLGEEFNEQFDNLVTLMLLFGYEVTSFRRDRTRKGWDYISSIYSVLNGKTHEYIMNIILRVDKQEKLISFYIHDNVNGVDAKENVFEYCYSLIIK
ncbi:gp201 [Bacillus phage G]|uniref:Gp201 n=1 Tax=Bacillus phage G TaxID=2884420 RepID=G3MBR7_9CAUD|nr:gp201 [Bacillus phage G]AEO93460.1 gp201 [Bacillus phage G]